jgi:two-component system, LuxR family, response regulator FixJ
MSAKASVYIVDDDEAVRRGLSALLRAKGFAVETFASADAFLAGVPAQATGCALVDIRLPRMSGLELQREMKRRAILLPVIIITGHGDVPVAVAALKAGAVDFLEKPFDSGAILAAIDEALRLALASGATLTVDRETLAERVERLTEREREVMALVVEGQPNKAIAHRLKIALRTVEIHRARVMEKTGARNLSELVRMAIRLNGSA